MDEQQSIMNNFLDILTDGVHSLKQENNKDLTLGIGNQDPIFKQYSLPKGEAKEKEISNVIFAMLAFLGFISQHSVTGKGRFDNLLQHLSDPWHNTIVQTLSGGN
ncbi:chlorophyll A/B-binding protein, putative [Medicago truncatula]|uniref:Chlorophyll a-b binding protein, chloroplastic n=1 Tax=Medicago truncatula TaxID=3880 RepID=G7KJ31_MEDTR|nr:chlorophyll A/B-binding protein, putative [Medicago truncatula]